MVEETSAASQQLESQATALRDLVGAFRLHREPSQNRRSRAVAKLDLSHTQLGHVVSNFQ